MKKLCSYALSLILIFSILPSSLYADHGRKHFSDIPNEHWAKTAIEKLVSKEVINGFPDGTFKPNKKINKAELAKILATALNLEIDENAKSSFIDVADDNWACKYIEASKIYLYDGEIPENTKFNPKEVVYREHIIKALIKASKLDSCNIKNPRLKDFCDKDHISEHSRKSFEIAIDKNIIRGYKIDSKKYLKPKEGVTRAELAKMIINVEDNTEVKIGRKHKKDKKPHVDVDKDNEKHKDNQHNNHNNDNKHNSHNNHNEHDNNAIQEFNFSIDNTSTGLDLTWDKVPSSKDGFEFRFYKVVASLNEPNPVYPTNGYAAYYTDINELNHHISVGDNYTKREKADFKKFEENQKYYIRITAVYADHHYTNSNVIYTTIK